MCIRDSSKEDLEHDIALRAKESHYYSETEILTMVYSVLNGLQFLRQHEIYHGAIQPKNIFKTIDATFKIQNYRLLTSGQSSYQQLILGIDSEIYLSPELFANYHFRRVVPLDFNREKSDVFSVGMTALKMATLKDIQNCYDLEQGIVLPNKIQEYLKMISRYYCSNFINCIAKLLELNEKIRWNLQECLQYLQNFRDQIILSKDLVHNKQQEFNLKPQKGEENKVQYFIKPK
eukprot:TRINITY_DN9804_c0_g1_i1.p1 TRINITY_DN9804_c0_g1~~TRINITY_DN9804_c0_g1_i1.p1  ORF type:complete len:233 (+),score=29.11 TRINITY_DN9804_c0_g1_i1:203-901(+)